MTPEQENKLDRILGGALPRTKDERFQVLQMWLQKHNARWHNEGKYGRADLEGFIVNGHVVYVLHMPDNSGWDLLMPVDDRNNIALTLWAAERACGLKRFAYVAVQLLGDTGFGIGRADEDVAGFTWLQEYGTFTDPQAAGNRAQELNREAGISDEEANQVIRSSMAAQNGR